MKEQQIVEMKEHLDKCCSDSSVATCIDYNCNGCRATYLYNQGYRKTDEGSIVWTKAEHEEIMQSLQNTLTNVTLHKCIIKQKEEEARQARKETAREILQIIKEKAWAYNEDEDGKAWNWEITQTDLDELAKQYGVEIEL